MENTIRNRLELIIKYVGKNKSEFAQDIGATKQEVSNWCSGTRMSLRRIKDMLDCYPQINGHWFITGKGTINIRASGEELVLIPNEKKDESIEYYKEKVAALSDKLIKCQEEIIELLEEKPKEN